VGFGTQSYQFLHYAARLAFVLISTGNILPEVF
jgi:hypothetical protein